jgi:hypothetical protein
MLPKPSFAGRAVPIGGIARHPLGRSRTLCLQIAKDGCGLLVYCRDYRCNHFVKIPLDEADKWPDDLRISDLEPRFVCIACGQRGAMIRGDTPPPKMGVLWHASR